MESAVAIIAIGAIVFLAHLFGAIFERTRIPDVLPLVLLGLLLGPITHFVHRESFGEVGHVFTTIALVIILFDCGLDIDIALLAKSILTSVKLGLLNFFLTVATTVVLVHYLCGMTYVEGCILGSIVAACSPPVVVPMLAKLRVTEITRTTLILETTICEVLGIVCTLAFLKFAQHNSVEPTVIVGQIIASFVLAAIVGSAAGLAWAKMLKFVRGVENNIFCTPAFVCIIFGAAEMFGWSGPVAALCFGLVLGNVSEVKSMGQLARLPGEAVSVSHMERTFFSALVFLLKSLFFVYVGISMRFTSTELFFTSFLLTVWTLLVRLFVTRFTVGNSLSAYDASIVSTMVPKGLAAAVLASMVMDSGLPAAGLIREMAFGVILFSITLVALLTFCIERGWLTNFYKYVFSNRPLPEAAAPGAVTAPSSPESMAATFAEQVSANPEPGPETGTVAGSESGTSSQDKV